MIGAEKSAPFLRWDMEFYMNGYRWDIMIVPPTSKKLLRSDGIFSLGVTDNNENGIYIVSGLSEYMFEKVLCHELCHCAAFSYGIHMDIETEEIVADFFSLYGRRILNVADKILAEYKKIFEVG